MRLRNLNRFPENMKRGKPVGLMQNQTIVRKKQNGFEITIPKIVISLFEIKEKDTIQFNVIDGKIQLAKVIK